MNFSTEYRIFWSLILAFILSSTVFADAYLLSISKIELDDIGMLDEENKEYSELENIEENEGKESSSEFSLEGFEDKTNIKAKHNIKTYLNYISSYFHFSCKYNQQLSFFTLRYSFPESYSSHNPFHILFHRLIFYHF